MIVLNTIGLRRRDDASVNYFAKNDNRVYSVFNILKEYVERVTEKEDTAEVQLREGIRAEIDSLVDNNADGYVHIVTDEHKKVAVPVPFGLGRFFSSKQWATDYGKRLFVPIPFTQRRDFCTELKYLDRILQDGKMLYQREA